MRFYWFCSIALAFSLVGCGLKGDLVLSEQPSSSVVPLNPPLEAQEPMDAP